MDFSAISGAYQSVKAVRELLGGLIDAKADAAAKDKVAEVKDRLGAVQDTLFDLRDNLAALQEENSRLRAQLSEVAAWIARAEQYELIQTSGGAYVHRFKGQPEHYACPRCFESKALHILQNTRTISGRYSCPSCEKAFPVEPARKVTVQRTSNYWP